jgi:hypothetical protein
VAELADAQDLKNNLAVFSDPKFSNDLRIHWGDRGAQNYEACFELRRLSPWQGQFQGQSSNG